MIRWVEFVIGQPDWDVKIKEEISLDLGGSRNRAQ